MSKHDSSAGRPSVARESIRLDAGQVEIRADISLPERSLGWVIVLNGAVSARMTDLLNKEGMATLRLAIYVGSGAGQLPVRAAELVAEATRSLCSRLSVPIAYLGKGPGGLAALLAASEAPCPVRGIVALDCHADALEAHLADIGASVLLVAGEDHPDVVEEDRRAVEALPHGEVLVVGSLEREKAAAREVASWLEALFQAPVAA